VLRKLSLVMVGVLMTVMSCQQNMASQKGPNASNASASKTDFAELRARAEAGDAIAQYNLAVTYDFGEDVPENNKEAVKWYRLAANQGVSEAQFNLALMYDEGEGVPVNDKEAVKWYRLAAKQGVANAQNNLAVMYANGEGVARNYVAALMWANIAVKNGAKNASSARNALTQLMSKADIARAKQMARACVSSGYKNCGT